MKRYTRKVDGRIVIVLPRGYMHHPEGIADKEPWNISSHSQLGTLIGGEAAERFWELENAEEMRERSSEEA